MAELTLDYYLSVPLNPYTEDNDSTQEEVIERGEFQFKLDSIVRTIDTDNCKFNIDLFINEVFEEFESDDQRRNFLKEIANKLIETYHLDILEQNFNNFFRLDQQKNDILGILFFFEKDQYIELVSKLYTPENPEFYSKSDKEILQFLYINYLQAANKLETFKGRIPVYVFYALKMMARKDFCFLILKLIKKNLNEILSRIYTEREGIRND